MGWMVFWLVYFFGGIIFLFLVVVIFFVYVYLILFYYEDVDNVFLNVDDLVQLGDDVDVFKVVQKDKEEVKL